MIKPIHAKVSLPNSMPVGCQREDCRWNETVESGCYCSKLALLIGEDGKCLDYDKEKS